MADNRKFLPTGARLVEANGTCYTISRSMASGGSAILYEAAQENSYRAFVLKECYPAATRYFFSRIDGVVRPADDSFEAVEYLQRVKQNMERENEIGQLIANATGRTIAPWGKLNVERIIIDGREFDAAGSLFIVMERVTDEEKRRGIFLPDLLAEFGGTPSAHITTKILAELLKSLRDIHNAGYIHGDINDANFFLMGHELSSGDIGVGQLLDFGNARKILSDGKTAPVAEVFSTPGYWSPEILLRRGELRLTAATDIFSVGCLMLYLFHGMKFKEARGRDLAASKRIPVVSVREAMRHGYRREAAELFRKILSRALKFKPEERYQNGGQMLEEIARLEKLTAPPKFLLSPNLSRADYFVEGSRDEEIAALENDMNRGKHPLFVYGVGGIGKTELANEFARRQIKSGTPAYLVTFKGTMRETILSLRFSGYEAAAPDSEEDYRRRLDILKEDYRGCLLIVDNFDAEEKNFSELTAEPEYKELVNGTGMKILITTRSRPDEATPELRPLTETDAMKLFTSISPVAAEDEPIVRELLRECDCHPMTVELLAKTREDSWQTISYAELLQRLRHHSLDDDNLPAVSVKKNLTEREAKIYGHLRTLFDVYKLGDCREVICHVTLLPADGFDAATFVSNEDDAQKIQLKNLERHSWIRRRKAENLLTIHPLIRTVFRNELRPRDEDCSKFLSRLWKIIDNMYPPNWELFLQAAELFERAATTLADGRGDFSFYAGFCFIAVGKISSAIFYEDRAVKIREQSADITPREMARTYNDAGVAAMSAENFNLSLAWLADDFDKGLNYLNHARKILETLPDVEDRQNLANVCASLAMSLGNREDFDAALPLAEKSVAIFEKYPPENLYEKAHAHQSLGYILLLKKRYAEALEQTKQDVAIKEQLIPIEHPELAKAYRELAEAYNFAGDTARAEEYALKSASMFERIFPDGHAELLATYKLLTEFYRVTNRAAEFELYTAKSEETLRKVHESIWTNKLSYARRMIEVAEVPVDEKILRHNRAAAEKILSAKASDLVKYNRSAAEACRQLKNFVAAEKFILAAEKNFSSEIDAAEKAKTFLEAAKIFAGQEKFSKAVVSAGRALKIFEETSPRNFDKLSETAIFLGSVQTKLGDLDGALKNFGLAIEFQKKNPTPENAVTELASRSLGETLMRLGRFDEAIKILNELLTRQRTFLYESQPRIEEVKKLLRLAKEKKLPDE